ncbi:MAG: uL15m family ribosomal protein [Candidatus Methanofastidiosia archaeon]
MRRKRKKTKKLRGSRTCGGGNAKKRRGAGNRGGRGLAGSGKNKKTKADWVRQNLPGHLGKRGFKRPLAVISKDIIMNVHELDENIDQFIQEGTATVKGDIIVVNTKDFGVTKILGKGRVTKKLDVTAPAFSESAVKKIEAAGGSVHASS